MDILISNANNQPIYEQIYVQIKTLIISGKLKEGDLLPSIRSLAKDLRISVITTKRAYDELERDGYIYSLAHGSHRRFLRRFCRHSAWSNASHVCNGLG